LAVNIENACAVFLLGFLFVGRRFVGMRGFILGI
jgi:hypothetical protein